MIFYTCVKSFFYICFGHEAQIGDLLTHAVKHTMLTYTVYTIIVVW